MVIAATVLGAICMVGGLVLLLRASAGRLVSWEASDFSLTSTVRSRIGEIREENVDLIGRGRRLGIFAVTLILIATLTVLIGYRAGTRLAVETGEGVTCGIVTSADDQLIVIEVAGVSKAVEIPFDDVVNMKPVSGC